MKLLHICWISTLLTICTLIYTILQYSILYCSIYILIFIICYYLTIQLIYPIQQMMKKHKIIGYDLNKKGTQKGQKQIPQCIGYSAVISCCIILCLLSIHISINHTNKQYILYLGCFITISLTILLGFTDDMLDLKWRHKIIFPFISILPLIMSYSGPTHIIIPYPFSLIFNNLLQLGPLYFLYITLLAIYCTNTINIYAGINGLQIGQTIIISISLLLYFIIRIIITGSLQCYYPIYLIILLLSSSLALLKFNQYPSQIFVGDTYCYFAGIVIAICAIIGQIPLICHTFMIPQLINFLYSAPQLFGIYFCPRHRLTSYDVKKDKLLPINEHMNLLNLSLRIIGPTNQGQLCIKLIIFQIITSLPTLFFAFIFI